MRIVSVPKEYSPAYSEAVFKINASPEEIVNVDIFNGDNSRIIGKKRFAGSTDYDINVANYAKRQLDVNPVSSDVTKIDTPEKRSVNVRIEANGEAARTTLCAGIYTLEPSVMLSNAPAVRTIGYGECDEISFLPPSGNVSAEATLSGQKGNVSLCIATAAGSNGLKVLSVNMEDLDRVLKEKKLGDIHDYGHMAITVMCENNPVITVEYNIVAQEGESVRLCWWNPYGQVDYYTFVNIEEETVSCDKTKIYSSGGYQTVKSSAESLHSLASAFENRNTMRWLGEIVTSPKVWMLKNGCFVPVDIITGSSTIKPENLNKLNITVREAKKTEYQNL